MSKFALIALLLVCSVNGANRSNHTSLMNAEREVVRTSINEYIYTLVLYKDSGINLEVKENCNFWEEDFTRVITVHVSVKSLDVD